jgi:hypothetical protein
MLKSAPEGGTVAEYEKMPFEVAPFLVYLTRPGRSAAPASASTTASNTVAVPLNAVPIGALPVAAAKPAGSSSITASSDTDTVPAEGKP